MHRTPAHSPDAARVDELLATMSLAEMAAQLGSYWHPADPAPPENGEEQPHDVAPMEQELSADRFTWGNTRSEGLGHLTRVYGTAPVTPDEGRARLDAWQAEVRASSRHGVGAIAHEECLTGITALGATVYPAAIAWGATWRPELVAEMAAAIGRDMRVLGVHQGLSPLLDVVRDYRWGRTEETCGEDPYLVGTLGTAYVRGLQSSGTHACLKHFAGYPASRAGRNHAPVSVGRRELEDVHLVPFEMAVRGAAPASVMNSYCDIDGQPATSSRWLLTEVLRERWGFEGTVVSDYWSVRFLQEAHRVAPDSATAAALAIRAGLDVELPATGAYAAIPEAVERGLLSVDDVRTATRRVLLQKAELGLLDDGADEARGEVDLDSDANRDVARRMAEESVVLLKNDGALPLRSGFRAALIGPSWTDPRAFMGCYSFPNHVLSRYPGKQVGLPIRALDEALESLFDEPLTKVAGSGFTEGSDEEIAEAVAAARGAEVAILTVGDIAGLFGVGTSGEGCDVVDLALPGRQGELVEAVLATGTPTVLVLITGRPYALGEYADRCAAIVQAFMPGVEGADAIAGVLSGRVNPSGHLPIAIPALRGGQPGTYLAPTLGWDSHGISNLDPRPLYPFGFGLSYTSFRHFDAAVSAPTMTNDGSVDYAVTITNDGDRPGSDVVQLYLSDPWAEVVRPLKQLVGYVKVDLEPGESRRVTFTLHADRTSFTGTDHHRIVEPGEILLSVGHDSEDRLEPIAVEITGERRVVGEGRVLTTPVRLG
ncbi:MAG: glycosyl hydrolase [Propionibacterium sp.]|nr:glycosyl hydrolase [Propionibacterium sp.]